MADYTSKFTGEQIDALLKQGVPIYDDMSKLPQDATVGSLAAVAVPGAIKESSFRDLYQPTMDMIDQATGTLINPERLSSISSLKFTAPSSFELEKSIIILFIPRTWSVANNNMLMLGFQGGTGIVAIQTINNREEHNFTFVDYSSGSPVINEDSINQFNDILATDDWCYFGNLESATGITEEQFNTLDMYVKAVSGVPSTAEIYIKKDEWEELHKSEFKKLTNNIDTKTDVVPVSYTPASNILKPNTYYTSINYSTGALTFILATPANTTRYNEYILELRCASTPESVSFTNESGTALTIKWANNNQPAFLQGSTYIISIVNQFGVFAEFNS